MSFVNLQISLDSLPEFSTVEFVRLHPHHARVALGVALCFETAALILATVLLFLVLVPNAGLPLSIASFIYVVVLTVLVFVAWLVYKTASVIRYAVRQHDVIVHSGVFWKKETVQPIGRIQHVEQHQGPVDKRFGLYELKLFSAGTGHFTFRIPGLDAAAAARIKQFILDTQQDDWSDDPAFRERVESSNGDRDRYEGDAPPGGHMAAAEASHD